MFNIGGGELLVIMLIALIVLGPQRLPDAARQIGKTMGDLRRLSSGFQNEMRSALDTADDPNRIAPRRNVLAKDGGTAEPALNGEAPATDAIAAVSAQPAAPAKKSPPAAQARTSARKAPLKAAPVKPSAPAAKRAPAKKSAAAAKSATAKKPTPAKKKAAASVPKASPRRSKG